jgi:hypothetical protein
MEALESMEVTVRQEILRAVGCNCACQYNEAGDLTSVCTPHRELAENETSFVNHMEFARRLRKKWVADELNEHLEHPQPAA